MWRATFTSALYKIAGVVPKPEFLDREKREAAFRKAIAEMDATEVGKREETSYNKWVQAFNKAADRDHLTATEREDMEEMISCGPELEITRVIVNLTRSDHRNTVVAALDHPSNTVKWIAAETLENPILSFAPHYLTKAAAEALQAALRKLDAENSESAEAKIARERAAAAIVKSLYTVTGTAPKEEHSNPKERDAAFEKAIQEMPAAK